MSEDTSFKIETFSSALGISPSEIAQTHLRVRQWQEAVGQNRFSNIEESQRDLAGLEEYYIGSGGNFFVATNTARVLLGFVGLHADGQGQGIVKRLAVVPEHHRRGIGRALVGELVAWAQCNDFFQLTLHTNRSENARSTYEEAGFEVVGYLPEHDDWVMALDFALSS